MGEEFFRKCDVAMPKPTDPQPTEPVSRRFRTFSTQTKEMHHFSLCLYLCSSNLQFLVMLLKYTRPSWCTTKKKFLKKHSLFSLKKKGHPQEYNCRLTLLTYFSSLECFSFFFPLPSPLSSL